MTASTAENPVVPARACHLLQLTKSGTIFSGSTEDLRSFRTQFERSHCVVVPRLLEPKLLRTIQHRIDQAEFEPRVYEGIRLEVAMKPDATVGLLNLLVNDRRFCDLVREITGFERIGYFSGRVYRMIPGEGHYDRWHDDAVGHRLVGMSVNLSAEPYRGGILQICEAESRRILHEVVNVGIGDAALFRIAGHLKHRVTDVEGTVPKTAFAGWFRSEPDFFAFLRGEASDG